MKTLVAFISFVFLIRCKEKPAVTNNLIEQIPVYLIEVDTSIIILQNGYYQFIPITDSTSLIKWGNQNISNISKSAINNYYLEKGRTSISWQTDKFIALSRSTGSDTWIEIILPQIIGSDAIFFQNPLAIDKENGIVVLENSSDSDSTLIAENIITGQQQAIGKNWEKCSSFFNHYCIDSISFSDKILYVEWATPNNFDSTKTKRKEKIKVDL